MGRESRRHGRHVLDHLSNHLDHHAVGRESRRRGHRVLVDHLSSHLDHHAVGRESRRLGHRVLALETLGHDHRVVGHAIRRLVLHVGRGNHHLGRHALGRDHHVPNHRCCHGLALDHFAAGHDHHRLVSRYDIDQLAHYDFQNWIEAIHLYRQRDF